MIKQHYISYWDSSKEISFDFNSIYDWSIKIRGTGKIEIEHSGEYYGPTSYWYELDIYDLCCLIALWEEVYGDTAMGGK